MRCNYYGNAKMTEKELRTGYDKYEDIFVLAAMSNINIFWDTKLKTLFEKEILDGDMLKRHLINLGLIKKQLQNIENYIYDDLVENSAPKKRKRRCWTTLSPRLQTSSGD